MAEISIDRLTLKLSGISHDDSQRLARLIAEGLATSSINVEGAHHLDTMRVNVTTSSANRMDNMNLLAKQIVTGVLQQLETTLT
jgi:hypothetical protein